MPDDIPPVVPSITLSSETLARAAGELAALDADLARIYRQLGPPPLWSREPGFASLVFIILEQQVSLASARAAFGKLQRAVPGVAPEALLKLSDEAMKLIGFSRQKAAYCRGLAQAVLRGELDFSRLHALEDAEVRAELTKIKGIGAWTADIYLLQVMLRPDIWPVGDLALVTALQKVKGLAQRPGAAELEKIGDAWRPWRAVAARLLWSYYLQVLNPSMRLDP